ncbi:hypothetical protein ABT56_05775 [Photobacterium aquae]|uniref:Uncharacterized protein n=2 Tax=Photobacterium aquae TaxID=1195763 RepID=A0A0J1H5S3_9GAMM|nr:hypothetical protein ABT56_05775 [Photobacterium aquae]
MMSPMLMAQTPADVYQNTLSNNDTGVYTVDEHVYFVVKQECLSKKKYAGTAESKAAEQEFYKMLAREMVDRSVSFSDRIADITQPLRSDIKLDVSTQLNAQTVLKHQLLFDRNTAANNCIQEYVVVVDSKQFQPNGVTIPRAEVESSAVKLLSAAVQSQDYSRVRAYLQSLGLEELANIYQHIENSTAVPVNLAVTDERPDCQQARCGLAEKAFSDYDIHHVVATILGAEGVFRIENKHPSYALADILFKRAESNFSQGRNAQGIIDDLTLSVNLAPQKAQSWKMLADISRALGQKELAQASSKQYIMQSPDSPESWVYLYLSQIETDPKAASQLRHWLQLINKKNSFSPWSKKQISGE